MYGTVKLTSQHLRFELNAFKSFWICRILFYVRKKYNRTCVKIHIETCVILNLKLTFIFEILIR